MLDFSLPMLEELLLTFKRHNYLIARFDYYWKNRLYYENQEKVVLLRHDVDRFPEMALATAKMEAKYGICGTYFFRVKPWVFKENIIKSIVFLGHEIGYHYETMVDAKGSITKANLLFRESLDRLRQFFPVVSASMHSRPLSNIDNRTYWNHIKLEEHGLSGEVYRNIDHYKFIYLSDSGRNWGGDKNIVWDSVDGGHVPKIEGTKKLCRMVDKQEFTKLQLLIHPNRWPEKLPNWFMQYCIDAVLNVMKTVIKKVRGCSCYV